MMALDVADPELRFLAGYPIERELGRGRHSIVYLSRHADGTGPVALKVRKAGLDCAKADFNAEFAVQQALAHPNVIEALSNGMAGGQPYLAMEYAAGGSMAAHVAALEVDMIFSVVAQAARALSWVHSRGWVHRDVKPSNLLVRADGSVALGDFDCARPRGHVDGGPPGTVTGTPRYAAPEQSQGCAAAAPADVYSLGVCLYEMLSGQALYPGVTLTELLGQHLLAPVPRLARERAAWQPLLDAMLAKDPQGRPADGEAVASQLQRMEQALTRNPI